MTAMNQEQESAAMTQAQDTKAKPVDRRKALSPELREVLHMLTALETELNAKQAASS